MRTTGGLDSDCYKFCRKLCLWNVDYVPRMDNYRRVNAVGPVSRQRGLDLNMVSKFDYLGHIDRVAWVPL